MRYAFPDPEVYADEAGVVAVGGPMNADRLLAAYARGIFPWSGEPVRWYSPPLRAVFLEVRLPRKLGKMMRRGQFSVSYDQAFAEVMRACAEQHGGTAGEATWITDEFVRAYTDLHRRGHAHSVEIWQAGQLVGKLANP